MVQGEGDSTSSGGGKNGPEVRKSKIEINIDINQVILLFIMALILISVIGLGAVAYNQHKIVQYGNCAAIGGEMVQQGREINCIISGER